MSLRKTGLFASTHETRKGWPLTAGNRTKCGTAPTTASHSAILRGQWPASNIFSARQPRRRQSAVFEFRIGFSVLPPPQYARIASGSLRFRWTALAKSWMRRPISNNSSTTTTAASPLPHSDTGAGLIPLRFVAQQIDTLGLVPQKTCDELTLKFRFCVEMGKGIEKSEQYSSVLIVGTGYSEPMPSPTRSKPFREQSVLYICCICNLPVQLETSKTNEFGKVVHGECYALKIVLKYA